MRNCVRYVLFLALTVVFSCDKIPLFVKCADCVKDEPVTAILDIRIDGVALDNISSTVINIYSGNLEDDVLLVTFPATGTDMTYKVTINKKYTITATYNLNEKTYVAVDSVTPGVKYDTSQCSEPCYYIYNKRVNLKIKYT
jgi:hypothetical protein